MAQLQPVVSEGKTETVASKAVRSKSPGSEEAAEAVVQICTGHSIRATAQVLRGTAQLGTSDFASCPIQLECLQGLCLYASVNPACGKYNLVFLCTMLAKGDLTRLCRWVY